METAQARPLYLDPARPTVARLDDLLGRMTVDEKFAQLTAFWYNELQVGQKPSVEKMQKLLAAGIGQITRVGGSGTLTPLQAARAGNVIQHFLVEQTRLGIPALLHEECCAGYMGLGGSIFPQMIGLASAWDPTLVQRVTVEIRRQMLAIGARQGLGPVLDIGRDPRWGRIEETFGEDPLLVAQTGMAYIRGLQGDDISAGVLATGKHFVGHSMSLGGMNCAPVEFGRHALWETYLAPFQAAIRDAGLKSVMNAYPELDGVVVAGSRSILTDLLRGKLGFEGLVVSDYLAIPMINNYHRLAPDERTAAVMAFKAGIDVELPTRQCYGDPLRAAFEAGEVTPGEIDAVVRRILQTKFDLGLFEKPYVDDARVPEVFETADQRALAREAARQSMVLLKNDGLLPLDKPRTIAVVGPNADAPRNLLGDYSYDSTYELMSHSQHPGGAFIQDPDPDFVRKNSAGVPSILEGIRARAGKGVRIVHAAGCSVLGPDRSGFDAAVAAAAGADVVVLVLGDKAGLVPDCSTGETRDRSELGLPGVQDDLARAVVAAGKPVVAVLINGRPLSVSWLHEQAGAILEAWLPGEEGAAAVAEVLFGDANPGGKLPLTVARSAGQLPIYYNHKSSGSTSNWYVDYVELPATPLYPFGHGLSYTTFSYSDLSLSAPAARSGGQVEIALTLANTGKVAGDEVVQLYIHDEYASIPRPVKELKGFCRISLRPGEKRRVKFALPVDLLAFYDENLDLVVEPGAVKIMIGASSQDIRLEGQFEISGSGKTPVAARSFVCPVTIE